MPLVADRLTVGRSRRCDVSVNDPSVSRKHAFLSLGTGKILLQDLGSSNGTFVNEERVTGEAELYDGDALRLGDAEIQVRIYQEGENAPTIAPPPVVSVAPGASSIGGSSVAGSSVAMLAPPLGELPGSSAPGSDLAHAPPPVQASPITPATAVAAVSLEDLPPQSPQTVVERPGRPSPEGLRREDLRATAPSPVEDLVTEKATMPRIRLPAVSDLQPGKAQSGESQDLESQGTSNSDDASSGAQKEDPESDSEDPSKPEAPPVAKDPAQPLPPLTTKASPKGEWKDPHSEETDAVPILAQAQSQGDASIRLRGAAVIIDALWIAALAWVAFQVNHQLGLVLSLGCGLLVPWLGWGIWGTTPGKGLFGLYVVTQDGQKIGLLRSGARLLGFLLSAILLGAGFIMAAFSEDQKALHDRLAGTRVTRLAF